LTVKLLEELKRRSVFRVVSARRIGVMSALPSRAE